VNYSEVVIEVTMHHGSVTPPGAPPPQRCGHGVSAPKGVRRVSISHDRDSALYLTPPPFGRLRMTEL